jgi:hypothetical protein
MRTNKRIAVEDHSGRGANVWELREDELLTDADVAQLLKVSTFTLRFWRCRPPRHPVPPVVRIGRTVRYRAGDIRRFMAELNAA